MDVRSALDHETLSQFISVYTLEYAMSSSFLPGSVLRLVKWASTRRVLAVSLVVFMVLLWLISWSPFHFSNAGVAEVNAGRGTLDLLIGYSPGEGRELLSSLGTEGHRRYDQFQLLDLVFPLSYALALSGALYALWARRGWMALSAVPLVQALIDYTENICVRMALEQSPNAGDGLLRLTAALTIIKNVLLYVSMTAIIIGIVVMVVARLRRRDHQASV